MVDEITDTVIIFQRAFRRIRLMTFPTEHIFDLGQQHAWRKGSSKIFLWFAGPFSDSLGFSLEFSDEILKSRYLLQRRVRLRQAQEDQNDLRESERSELRRANYFQKGFTGTIVLNVSGYTLIVEILHAFQVKTRLLQ